MVKNVLLIEDNEEHIIITKRAFKEMKEVYKLEAAKGLREAMELLSAHSFDLILCDYALGEFTAMDVLKEIKAKAIYTPFIVITSQGSEKIAVALLHEGAADYVIKDDGFPGVLEVVIKHVLDRHRANESTLELKAEIENKNSFINLALNSLAYPFYVIDTNFSIEFVNKAGIEKGIVPGNKCHKMTHGLDAPCASETDKCPLVETIKTKKPIVLEHIHYDAQGQERYVEVHGDPILDKNGDVSHMIEYSIDITDRKLMEAELKKKVFELEVFNKSAVNREIKMIELKKKIVELENQLKK